MDAHTMSDGDLATLCREGSMEHFETLYLRHLKGIFAFIFYRTMDRATAEDLTSQTFLKALEHIGSYRAAKGAFSTWLYRIARNTVTDHFRTLHPHRDIEDVWDLPAEDNPFLETNDRLSREQIRAALQKLPAEKRRLVMLRLWDGLSYAAIADLTGKTEAGCKMMVLRTIQDLKKELGPAVFLLLCLFPVFR